MNAPMISVGLFGLSALGGAFLAALRFRGKDLPMPIALVHGAVAASGLGLLGFDVTETGLGGTKALALAILVVAALGGFVLFSFHLRKKPLPIPLLLIHALVAVAGFATLCAHVFLGK
jgi:hypothetical protein